MPNVEALRNILEHTEGLGLPEGDYLRIANALRNALTGAETRTVRQRYVNTSRMTITAVKTNSTVGLVFLRSERFIHTDGTMSGTTVYETTSQNKGEPMRVQEHTTNSPFPMILANWLDLVRPLEVIIKVPALSDYKVACTLKKIKKDWLKTQKDKIKYLETPGLPEGIKSTLLESLAEDTGWCYDYFKTYVMNALPSLEETA